MTGSSDTQADSPKAVSARPESGGGRRWFSSRPFLKLFAVACFLVIVLLGLFWVWSIIRPLPSTPELGSNSWFCDTSTDPRSCDATTAVGRIGSGEARTEITLADVPQVIIDAVIAAEDRAFYDHGGIHGRSILRAALVDSARGRISQGGSTITQQLVKNDFLDSDRTWYRKLDEASLAIRLERSRSKDEILERYLNIVYFGRGAYGVAAASEAWFGHPVADVDLADAALLAGLIRGPNSADPASDPEETIRRRMTVLDAMAAERYVTREAADRANLVPVTPPNVIQRVISNGLVRGLGEPAGVEFAADWARRELGVLVGSQALFTGDYSVISTIDTEIQAAAFTEAASYSAPSDPEVSIVVLDRSGQVKAMVGGRDFATSQVNLAMGLQGGGTGRQAGSVFKPIVLAEALRQGWSVRSTFDSPAQVQLDGASGEWNPANYAGVTHGRLDLIKALAVSSNTVYAQLAARIGPLDVARMGTELGIDTPLIGVDAIALGAEEVSVLDMATAYATLANSGTRVEPHIVSSVWGPDGQRVFLADPERVEVLAPTAADTVEAAMRTVVESGTGQAALVPNRWMVGKTGTSQDHRDAWFVGSTCELTIAVWMGHSDGRPLHDVSGVSRVTGGSLPAQIFSSVVQNVPDRGVECAEPTVDRSGSVIRGDDID